MASFVTRWLHAPIMLFGINGVAIWMIRMEMPIVALLPLALLVEHPRPRPSASRYWDRGA